MSLPTRFPRLSNADLKKPLTTIHCMDMDDDVEMRTPLPSTDRDAFRDHRRVSDSTRLFRFINDCWLLEISSLAISIAAVIAAAVILQSYDGRPLQEWKHKLSINAVLSFVAIISKATMVLAMSSTLGQMKWNWYAAGKGSQPLLDFQTFDAASRGPLGSMYLMLRLRRRSLSHLAAIVMVIALAFEPFTQQAISFPLRPRTSSSTASIPVASAYRATEYSNSNSDDGSNVELSMKAAIYDGLFYSNVSQTAASVSPICESGNCTFPQYASLSVCSRCENVTSLIDTTDDWNTDRGNMSLPNGLILYASQTSFASSTGVLNTAEFADVQTVLTNFSVLGELSFGYGSAYDCIIYFCGQTYRSSVTDGAFVETVDDTVVPSDPYRPSWATSSTPDIFLTIPNQELSTDKNVSFSVASQTNDALSSFLRSTLRGNVTKQPSSDIIQALYRQGSGITNITNIVSNIAMAMSNHIRLTSGESATGSVVKMDTFIEVLWEWLILPSVLELISIIVLVLTICVSNRRGVPVWKVSALAPMFHGVPKHMYKDERLLKNDEMETFASSTRVLLSPAYGRLGLAQAEKGGHVNTSSKDGKHSSQSSLKSAPPSPMPVYL